MLVDAESASEGSRTTAAIESEYPAPPQLSIPAWSRLIAADTTISSPRLLARFDSPAPSTSIPTKVRADFYRRASWAPDGSVLLAITESQRNHILRCYLSQTDDPNPSTNGANGGGCRGAVELLSELKSPSPLLDAVWYPVPAMDSAEEAGERTALDQSMGTSAGATSTMTWCFAESHRDLPIRLTASSTGEARASYSIMNHVERFVGPHSLAFSPDLSRLYCGLWSALAVFPLSRPGLNTHSSLPLVAGRRSRGGQRGIVSTLVTAPSPHNPAHDLVAVGTFSGSVGIYDFDPAAFLEPAEHTARHDEDILAQTSCLAGWSEIEGDGVTQLRFHPLTPYVLFVASRRSDHIYVYDIRYLMGDTNRWSFRPLSQPAAGVRSAHLLAKLHRPSGASAQRLYFDVDWAGRWLAAGDDQGSIHLWRIDTGRFTDADDGQDAGEAEIAPDLSWKAHHDAVGSVSFHPHQPWLASVSGSRHWPEDQEDSSESERDSSTSTSGSASDSLAGSGHLGAWQTRDSSLKIWDLSDPHVLSS